MYREISKDDVIVEGQRLIYMGNMTPFPNGKYFAEVLKIFPHHILLEVALDQSSTQGCWMGSPKPRKVSVAKVNVGLTEKLYYY